MQTERFVWNLRIQRAFRSTRNQPLWARRRGERDASESPCNSFTEDASEASSGQAHSHTGDSRSAAVLCSLICQAVASDESAYVSVSTFDKLVKTISMTLHSTVAVCHLFHCYLHYTALLHSVFALTDTDCSLLDDNCQLNYLLPFAFYKTFTSLFVTPCSNHSPHALRQNSASLHSPFLHSN